MPPTSKSAAQILLTLAAVALTAAIGFSRTFYDVSTLNPFMWWVLCGVVIIHLRVHPSWQDALLVAFSGILFSFVAFGLRGLDPGVHPVCCYLGLGSLAVLGMRTLWATPEARTRLGLFPAFVASCVFVGFLYLAGTVLYYGERLQPKTLDLYLLSFDGSLGFQPSFVVGKYFWGYVWLRRAALFGYSGLPLALALAYVENLVARRERSATVGLGIFYLGALGVFAYSLFPATGPIHLFGPLFPDHPLASEQARTLALMAIPAEGPRNAMPSLHMAWVLWCWWCVRGLKVWVKSATLAFVVLTVISTLGTGEHYLIDLVVAFPFTLMILALFSLPLAWRNSARLAALFGGLGVTLLWFVLLRYTPGLFWISPLVPWTLALATIALVHALKSRLVEVLDACSPTA